MTISRTSRHFSLVDASSRSQLRMAGTFITFSDCLFFFFFFFFFCLFLKPRMGFFPLMYVNIPTIVGILTFMSRSCMLIYQQLLAF